MSRDPLHHTGPHARLGLRECGIIAWLPHHPMHRLASAAGPRMHPRITLHARVTPGASARAVVGRQARHPLPCLAAHGPDARPPLGDREHDPPAAACAVARTLTSGVAPWAFRFRPGRARMQCQRAGGTPRLARPGERRPHVIGHPLRDTLPLASWQCVPRCHRAQVRGAARRR